MQTSIIVAHRGIHHDHPENSLEALLQAWHGGVTWCECDVRGSRDDQPFLLHDGTLDRTTNGVGTIEQTAAADLELLKLRRHDGSLSNSHIPLFGVVIKAMPPGSRFLVEIKPKLTPAVIRRTLELCNAKTCVVQSFDADILRQAAEDRPDVERMLLVDKVTDPLAAEKGPWSQVNANFKSLDAGTVQMIRDRGMGIGAWTVNDESDIRRIIDLKLDMIISDEPLRVAPFANAAKIG